MTENNPEMFSYGSKATIILAAAAAGRALRHFDGPPRSIPLKELPVLIVWEVCITSACALLGYAASGALGLTQFTEILFIGLVARGGPTLLDEILRRALPQFNTSNRRNENNEPRS